MFLFDREIPLRARRGALGKQYHNAAHQADATQAGHRPQKYGVSPRGVQKACEESNNGKLWECEGQNPRQESHHCPQNSSGLLLKCEDEKVLSVPAGDGCAGEAYGKPAAYLLSIRVCVTRKPATQRS